jgi:hypothetical protein
MSAVDLLIDKWPVLIGLVLAWIAGIVVAQILYAANRTFAIKAVDWLDVQRKVPIQYFHKLLSTPWGVVKSSGFIFLVNLFGAGLFQHSLLGSLILPSFGFLFLGGLLVSLLVRRYPKRLLITVVVSPFEFGAFIVAATGSIGIGLSVLGFGDAPDTTTALWEWWVLFLTLTIPLQLIGAVLEAVLGKRLPEDAWPVWLERG